MPKYDVVVIGAGAAGLTAGALLAKLGKKVLVVDRDKHLGGRAMAIPHEGYRLNVGGHLLEDSGSGITKIFEFLGKKLEHGTVNNGMPFWDNEQGRWRPIQERYNIDKGELKKVINVLCDTEFSEFDKCDHMPLRTWLLQHTKSEGTIELFEYVAMAECLTEKWYDHSASDNLYVRKMHYQEKRTAGYSFWPVGGWDGLFKTLADAVIENGCEVRLETNVHRVIIEKGRVVAVALEPVKKAIPTEAYNFDVVETDAVLSTLPVWNVLGVVPEQDLPDWYVAQIKLLAQDQFKVCWLGYYAATHEPIYTGVSLTELAVWFDSPHSRLPGWAFLTSGMDPTTAPEGQHLFNCGFAFQGMRDRNWIERKFDEVDQDLQAMYPETFSPKNIIWKKRHLVGDPAFGVIQKPCLVGQYRPDYTAPGVGGLWFASETFRSRGIGVDRAARAALTCVEEIIGYRIDEFKDSWHY
ncbi:MAG: FAD-dependent oxidoreductase [Acidobacteria bacterium]|nr:FAD-dependent oxidoreductase [Acidobacteriota bacterium]